MPKKPRTAAELAEERKGRILTADEQDKYLVWYRRGLDRDKILKNMRISNSTYQLTRASCPEFIKALDEVTATRTKHVEVEAFKGALGAWEKVTTTYQMARDTRGNILRDLEGNSRLEIKEKKVEHYPPQWSAIQFILRTRMPDVYGTANHLMYDANTTNIDALTALLQAKAKELDGVKDVDFTPVDPKPEELGL